MKSLLQFLRRLAACGASPPAPLPDAVPPAPPRRAYERLDIQRVMIEHLEWCVAFNDHLGIDPQEALPAQPLPGPAESGLGVWLARAMAKSDQPDPLLQELADEYQRFHRLAAEALALVRADQMHKASTLLNTDFERSRARVLELLRSLQRA